MASDVVYNNYSYRLRAGAPMSKGEQGAGDFYVHTFMAECSRIDNYLYTETLPGSEEFRGQGGNFTSASFNRLSDRSGTVFAGTMTCSPNYIEEDDINNVSCDNCGGD